MSDDLGYWEDDYWSDRQREDRWERADELERAEELERDRLTRDLPARALLYLDVYCDLPDTAEKRLARIVKEGVAKGPTNPEVT